MQIVIVDVTTLRLVMAEIYTEVDNKCIFYCNIEHVHFIAVNLCYLLYLTLLFVRW